MLSNNDDKLKLLIRIDQVLNSTTSTLSQEDRDSLIEIKAFVQHSDWNKDKGQIVEFLVKWFFRGATLVEMAKKGKIIEKITEILDD